LRIVIGVVLVVLLDGVLTVVLLYQRELRIERKLESFDLETIWVYCGPQFLPKWVQENSRVFDRIEFLSSSGEKIFRREESSEFVNVSNLRGFNGMLGGDFTDADLESFKVLTRLESLNLENAQTTPKYATGFGRHCRTARSHPIHERIHYVYLLPRLATEGGPSHSGDGVLGGSDVGAEPSH
jgi:hypothetical protein